MVTIQDVAKAAGVSTATVSRVMNGSGYVSEATRKKVNNALKELDYSPNPFAKGLITKRSELIAHIITNIENPVYAPNTRGIQDVAWSRRYQVLICNTDGDEAKEIEYLTHLRRIRVDGIVHGSLETLDSATVRQALENLVGEGMPMVLQGPAIEGVLVDRVLINNSRGLYLVVEHLVGLGHRRIAFVGGPESNLISKERLRGFLEAMGSFGVEVDGELVRHGDYREISGRHEAKELLTMSQPPTAIVAANDLMAIGVLSCARELGVQVPQDLAITGFDDIPYASLVNPALTSVVQPNYDIGKRTATILFERIDRASRPPEEILIEPTLAIRESTNAMNKTMVRA